MSRKTDIAAVGAADAYALVQEELDAALATEDPEVAAAACRRAQFALAAPARGGPGAQLAEFELAKRRAEVIEVETARRDVTPARRRWSRLP